VAIVVWKGIHDDEMVFASMQNQIFFIFVLLWLVAKYAAIRLLAQDIINSPGRP
jgi:hypothetical protein